MSRTRSATLSNEIFAEHFRSEPEIRDLYIGVIFFAGEQQILRLKIPDNCL
jgi:hypothetical protein